MSILFLFLFIMIPMASAGQDILFNGTIYLTTGESRELNQGYVLIVKGVSGDGSVWLQLTDNDNIVRSEIVHDYGYLSYNKSRRTILSVKVDKVYSGSLEQNLVALLVYQSIDPDKPVPNGTGIPPGSAQKPGDDNTSAVINPPNESLIWILGIALLSALFYILRKLW